MKTKRLLGLADRLASGEPVDWKAEARSSDDDVERGAVRSMGDVAEISALHTRVLAIPSPVDDGTISLRSPEPISHWGRLEKLERIGQGAFGTVFKAWDPQLQIWVALKLARPDANGLIANMLEEARLLARLRHENIVRIYGADEHDGRFGIWMEYIEGRTLDQIVKTDGPLSEEDATNIGRKLALAVAAVHAAGVIHKDIKSHNVMREAGGRIVLMDFGAGARLEDVQRDMEMSSVRGTPFYLAPEVLSGKASSIRSDIYSLGVLLFFLVTKRYPIEAKTMTELEDAHRSGRVLSLVDIRPELSRKFCAVVQRALEPDPEQRFQSAGRLAHALERERKPIPLWVKASAMAAGLALVAASWFAWEQGSYTVESGLFRAGRMNQQLLYGARVSPGDRLYLELESTKSLHVYVLNEDEKGQASLLFPIPGLEMQNPLAANQKHSLPGALESQRIYWRVTSAGDRERFVVIAARKPLRDLEEVLKDLPPATFGHGVTYPNVNLGNIGALRGILGLAPAESTPATANSDLLQRISALTSEREKQRGVWVRRIDLENP